MLAEVRGGLEYFLINDIVGHLPVMLIKSTSVEVACFVSSGEFLQLRSGGLGIKVMGVCCVARVST